MPSENKGPNAHDRIRPEDPDVDFVLLDPDRADAANDSVMNRLAARRPEPTIDEPEPAPKKRTWRVIHEDAPEAEEEELEDWFVEPTPAATAPAPPVEVEPAGHDPDDQASGISSERIQDRITQVIDGLQGLEHLAELVSLRYNPFLEVNENDVFDGNRLPADELVQGYFQPKDPATRQATHPEFMEVGRVNRRSATEALDESIDLTNLPIDKIHTAVGAEVPLWEPIEETAMDDALAEADEEAPAPGDDDPAPAPMDLPDPAGAPRGFARHTLLVLAWFRRMQEHAPAAALYLFLDHGLRLGWMNKEFHAWFCELASGIVERDPELRFQDLELSAEQLTQIHEGNLLFLDDLFTDRLRANERTYLTGHVTSYFGAD